MFVVEQTALSHINESFSKIFIFKSVYGSHVFWPMQENVCTCILHVHLFVGEEGNNLLLAQWHCFKSSVISFEPNSIVWLKNNKITCYEQISFCSLSNLFCSDLPFSVHRGKQELKNSLTYKIYIWLFCYLYISLLLSTDCKLSVVAVFTCDILGIVFCIDEPYLCLVEMFTLTKNIFSTHH